jgi:hypothetical protein
LKEGRVRADEHDNAHAEKVEIGKAAELFVNALSAMSLVGLVVETMVWDEKEIERRIV